MKLSVPMICVGLFAIVVRKGQDFGLSRAHSGSYVVPLPWRHIFNVSASYSKSKPDIGRLFKSTGISWSVVPTYTVTLRKTDA